MAGNRSFLRYIAIIFCFSFSKSIFIIYRNAILLLAAGAAYTEDVIIGMIDEMAIDAPAFKATRRLIPT